MKRITFYIFLFIISFPCVANDNIIGKNEYEPYELELINLNISYGFFTPPFNDFLGLGLGFIFIGENLNEEKMSRFFETGLLSNYSLSDHSSHENKILQIRPYIHYGLIDYFLVLGATLYIGLSGVFSTDFNSNTFGISPAIGVSMIGLGIFFKLQIQYDININNNFNRFSFCYILSIPLNIWK